MTRAIITIAIFFFHEQFGENKFKKLAALKYVN